MIFNDLKDLEISRILFKLNIEVQFKHYLLLLLHTKSYNKLIILVLENNLFVTKTIKVGLHSLGIENNVPGLVRNNA